MIVLFFYVSMEYNINVQKCIDLVINGYTNLN